MPPVVNLVANCRQECAVIGRQLQVMDALNLVKYGITSRRAHFVSVLRRAKDLEVGIVSAQPGELIDNSCNRGI